MNNRDSVRMTPISVHQISVGLAAGVIRVEHSSVQAILHLGSRIYVAFRSERHTVRHWCNEDSHTVIVSSSRLVFVLARLNSFYSGVWIMDTAPEDHHTLASVMSQFDNLDSMIHMENQLHSS